MISGTDPHGLLGRRRHYFLQNTQIWKRHAVTRHIELFQGGPAFPVLEPHLQGRAVFFLGEGTCRHTKQRFYLLSAGGSLCHCTLTAKYGLCGIVFIQTAFIHKQVTTLRKEHAKMLPLPPTTDRGISLLPFSLSAWGGSPQNLPSPAQWPNLLPITQNSVT
jgi:hypothetical protein